MEATLTGQTAVPLIVLSAVRDPAEAINSALRQAGQPVQCTWLPTLRDLGDALTQINAQLVIQAAASDAELSAAIGIRDRLAPEVPLLLLASDASEARIAAAMALGARDVITVASPARLQAVVMRELAAARIERTLTATLRAERMARTQLDTVLERSNDAIMQVQEGIVVEANPAWLELSGVEEGLTGQPVMDLFEESTHVALRGALAACLQGRWHNHSLRANTLLGDGSVLPVDISLALGEHEGEPCVRLVVPSRPQQELKAAAAALTQVLAAGDGMLARPELLTALAERLSRPSPGGMRCIAVIRPDKFAALEGIVGVAASEEILSAQTRLIRESLHPKELAGRFGGVRFLALLERGNENDITAWAEQLLERVRKHVMHINEKEVSVTCSIGLSVVTPGHTKLDAVILDALECCRKSVTRGGNQSLMSDRADTENRVMSYDKVWVKHIKAALMENRFRLVQQPIASLQGEDPRMFDVLVRMIDPQGREVLPSEFMAAAARNDLMKNIDRWVVGASLSFAAQKKPECLFVRLSRETSRDPGFLEWLDHHLRSSRAEPRRLCFQVNEENAQSHLSEIKTLAARLRERKFRFAIESFGSGRDSQGLLEAVPLDFVKIDGTLVQGLRGDPKLQLRARVLIEAATRRSIQTIGERVEDANTMAVLWQLGVQYIQGYFVNQPEEVVLRAES
jgi:diguanylate cyclase (GGDEF)-like protein/PAS domain S-box-containing protein